MTTPPDTPVTSPPPEKTLYLIDGHAQIFRAYFAIRGGMNSPRTGEPTQAVFGMAGMFLKFFNTCRPQHVVMAIDLPGKTFRDDIDPQYKANRPPPPADLIAQEKRVFELTRLFGITVLGHATAEADDVIATLTRRLLDDPARSDWQVRIVSRDKDLEQLLTERVMMFDIHNDTTIDVAALQKEKGITPTQVIDMLALMGDSADNVRGVEGIGPKTAAQLIRQFGSIDGIYNHLDQIKGKRRENLEKARAWISQSVQLVTLKHDLPLTPTLDDMRVKPPDAAGLEHLFDELGFTRHRTELQRFLQQQGAAAASLELPSSPASSTNTPSPKASPPTLVTHRKNKPTKSLDFTGSLFEGMSDANAGADAADEQHHATSVDDDTSSSISTSSSPAGDWLGSTNIVYHADRDYQTVTSVDELREVAGSIAKQMLLAIDTETVGLGHRAALCGLSLSWQPGQAVYVPILTPEGEPRLSLTDVQQILGPVLADPAIGKCGHNLKYDWLVLRHAGLPLRGIVFDSMIASHLLGHPAHGIDDLAMSQFNHRMMQISALIGEGSVRKPGVKSVRTMDQVPLAQITPYACDDAEVALRLAQKLQPELRLLGMEALACEVEMPLVEALSEMEFNGIALDSVVLEEQRQQLTQRMDIVRDETLGHIGQHCNLDSPKQLAQVLFTQLGLPVVKRSKTGPSTDVEVLETLAQRDDLTAQQAQVLQGILEYRQLTKLVGTYLESLKESIAADTGRVHAQFHQTGAATGRLSSSGPNLQNIPIRTELGKQIRKAFVAPPGCQLVCADYSQIELRVLAHLSNDANLIQAFMDDMDIHTAVAAQVFHVKHSDVTKALRGHAKVINFGIVYGVTPYGLARRIEGMSVDDAKKLIADYKRKFAGIGAFLDQCIQQAEQLGYVTTILGRRRPIPQIKATNPNQRSLGERLAINSVVQGSAADLIKKAMVRLHQRIQNEKLPARLLVQVHDELVVETPADHVQATMQLLRDEMQNALLLKVPLKVDVGCGSDWLTAKGD